MLRRWRWRAAAATVGLGGNVQQSECTVRDSVLKNEEETETRTCRSPEISDFASSLSGTEKGNASGAERIFLHIF